MVLLQMPCWQLAWLTCLLRLVDAQDAARLRDQIREIEEANQPQPPEMEGLTTSSDTVTDGIRVKVRRWVALCGLVRVFTEGLGLPYTLA